jgi:hypothetical protein
MSRILVQDSHTLPATPTLLKLLKLLEESVFTDKDEPVTAISDPVGALTRSSWLRIGTGGGHV